MSKIANLRRHFWLLTKFSNGISLVGNLRSGGMLGNGPPMPEVLFWDGTRVTHPENRSGLIGTLLEVWYENVYRIGEFCTPQKGDVIIDIGAHVGLFATFVARKQLECELICIEASKENFKCLEQNIKAFENITAYNLARKIHKYAQSRLSIDSTRNISSVARNHRYETSSDISL